MINPTGRISATKGDNNGKGVVCFVFVSIILHAIVDHLVLPKCKFVFLFIYAYYIIGKKYWR